MKTPKPSSIHDVKYFLAGLRVLGRENSMVKRQFAEEEIRSEIERYVTERNLTFGLPERAYPYKRVPGNVLRELGLFEFLYFEKQLVGLTEKGSAAAKLLRERRSSDVYDMLATAHLATFTEFRHFIARLGARTGRSVTVANPNSSLLSEFVGNGGKSFDAKAVLSAIFDEVQALQPAREYRSALQKVVDTLFDEIRQYDGRRLTPEQKARIFRVIENDIERSSVCYFFQPFITTRARYDIVKDRLSDFSAVNVILRKKNWITEETVYAVAVPYETYSDGVFPTKFVKVLGGTNGIVVHWPEYNSQKKNFLKSLEQASKENDVGIGFADIPTIREVVCQQLMIPSSLFDRFLRNAASENKSKIDFALAPERVTATRLPILLATGKAYNLIRIREE